jgi:tRNA U34 5-carboxymethylaminomethyl modifying GTPase MnmE/TrmE
MNLDDTIVAIATPPGRGGIGVVRLAGPEARAIAQPMLSLSRELEPNRAIRCDLIESSPTHAGTDALSCAISSNFPWPAAPVSPSPENSPCALFSMDASI